MSKLATKTIALLTSAALGLSLFGIIPQPLHAADSLLSYEEGKLSFGKSTLVPVFPAASIEPDGGLREWEPYTGFSIPTDPSKQVSMTGWEGPDDLSAQVKLAYDAANLYLSVRVKDNVHTSVAGADMWNGDSVQIAFGYNDGTSYGPEYGFAHVNGSGQIYRWSTGSAVSGPQQVKLHTSQSGTETVYEIQMPWETISRSATAPATIPFSLLVNDNDGAGRRGWIDWTPAIGTGKNAGTLGALKFIPQGEAWSLWAEGSKKTEALAGTPYTFYVTNNSDTAKQLTITSPDAQLPQQVELPAHTWLKKDFVHSFSVMGNQTLRFSVQDTLSGQSQEYTIPVQVLPSKTELLSRFEQLSVQLAELERLLNESEAKGISTDYERVNYTVIKNFITYGTADVNNGNIERAMYVLNELNALYSEAVQQLTAYLSGERTAWDVPRYKTSRPEIKDYSFYADTLLKRNGSEEKRPVFFVGYGHFDQARKDIPQFKGYGTNIIQTEIGPNSVVYPLQSLLGWTVSKSGGVIADAVLDTSVSHSGKASMKITNSTAKKANTFIRISQNVPVKPNTKYNLSVWVKGTNVKDAWFPGGPGLAARKYFPAGTYDWQKVTYSITTGATVTSYPFVILNENTTGALWVDDLSMKEDGTDQELLANPSYELGIGDTNKEYLLSDLKLKSDIVPVLQQAEKHDVSVSLLISPHYFPSWALTKWPELQSKNNSYFFKYIMHHPKAKEILSDYIKTLIPLVKDYKSLHSITLTNEPTYSSFVDEYNLPEWYAFLQKTYREIGELNRVYGTSYSSFDQVAMPTSIQAQPVVYDWVTFNNQLFGEWHRWLADQIHAIAPELPVHSKSMNTAFSREQQIYGVDFEQFSDFSQINGNDSSNYISYSLTNGFMRQLKFFDLQGSLKRAPIYNSEDHIIPDGNNEYIPEHAKQAAAIQWQGAMHGRSASTIWVWERTTDKNSVFFGSILHRPDAVAAVGKTSLNLNRLAMEVTAFQHEPAQVAILYSLPSLIYSEEYRNTLNLVYEALTFSGQKIGFVTEKQIASGQLADSSYKLLVIPSASHVLNSTVTGIAGYAEKGGKVVLIGEEALKRDEHNLPIPEAAREAVLAVSQVLPAAEVSTAAQTREHLLPILKELKLDQVMLNDPSGSHPAYGVEWRSIRYEGKTLVNMINYTKAPIPVTIVADNRKAGKVKELISGTEADGRYMVLEPLQPYLVEITEIDETPPTTAAAVSDVNGKNGWYISDPTITLTPSDNLSGVAETVYRIDGGQWVSYSQPVTLTEEGIHSFEFKSKDAAGNEEAVQSLTIKLDKTNPILQVGLDQTTLWPPNHKLVAIKAEIAAVDSVSTLDSVILSSISSSEPDSGLDEGDLPDDIQAAEYGTQDTEFSLRAERSGKGTGRVYTITYTAEDQAGNKADYSVTVTVPHDHSGK